MRQIQRYQERSPIEVGHTSNSNRIVPKVSSLEFQCASMVILFYFFHFSLSLSLSLSLISSQIIRREEREKQRNKKNKITLEAHRSSDDDTTDIIGKILIRQIQRHKKSHNRWTEWAIQVVQKCWSSLAFKLLVWPTLITVNDLLWYC